MNVRVLWDIAPALKIDRRATQAMPAWPSILVLNTLYNIARIFTKSNFNSASVCHILIEHANDVNKLTVQCSFPSL